MGNRVRTRTVIAGLVALVGMAISCGSPTAPSSETLSVKLITPTVGSTAGATAVMIAGSGFQPGATVTLDGATTNAAVIGNTAISASTSAHAAGTVDVIVTNPGGQSVKLAAGYTFVPSSVTVTAVSPNIGSTTGRTLLTISGTGFLPDATVTVGGLGGGLDVQNSTTIVMATTAHAAGTVDVVVTNPGGPSERLVGAYTYALPQSFDVNGNWESEVGDAGLPLLFTIQNNTVVSFSCGTPANVAPSPPPPVTNGAFSFPASGGGTVSGTIVSPAQAAGSINTPACLSLGWFATKR